MQLQNALRIAKSIEFYNVAGLLPCLSVVLFEIPFDIDFTFLGDRKIGPLRWQFLHYNNIFIRIPGQFISVSHFFINYHSSNEVTIYPSSS